MEVSGEEEEAREAHMSKGTLERGGMRIYLVSHLAKGSEEAENSHTGPSPARWPAYRDKMWEGRKDGKDLLASGSVFQLNQYGPCGSISAV